MLLIQPSKQQKYVLTSYDDNCGTDLYFCVMSSPYLLFIIIKAESTIKKDNREIQQDLRYWIEPCLVIKPQHQVKDAVVGFCSDTNVQTGTFSGARVTQDRFKQENFCTNKIIPVTFQFASV